MSARSKPWPGDLVAAFAETGVGGVGRTYAQLLGRLVDRGNRGVLVAPISVATDHAAKRGVDVLPVDWQERRTEAVRTAVDAGARAGAAVMVWSPRLVPAIVAVAATDTKLVVALHSPPAHLPGWFGPDHATSVALLRTLVASRRVVLTVRGPAHRRAAVHHLGLDDRGLVEVPIGIDLDEVAFHPRGGDSGTVLALARLSLEKLSVVRCAARLAAARPGCRLVVIGDGPARSEAIEILEAHLPDHAWRLEGPTAVPLERMAEAGVVVTQGRTALEAAALGRRTVVARSHGAQAGGAVVTARTYDQTVLDAFAQPALELDPAVLWNQIDAVDPAELRRVRRCVEHRNPADAEDRGVGKAVRRAQAVADPVLAAVTDAWLVAEQERCRTKEVADMLWAQLELAQHQVATEAVADGSGPLAPDCP